MTAPEPAAPRPPSASLQALRTELAEPRHDWTRAEVAALFDLPFPELTYLAATVHRRWFDPTEVQLSQPAVHQDRRLCGELRLLQPVGLISRPD